MILIKSNLTYVREQNFIGLHFVTFGNPSMETLKKRKKYYMSFCKEQICFMIFLTIFALVSIIRS